MLMDPPPTADDRVVIRRMIAATPDELFAAWTDADTMRLWMRPDNWDDSSVRLDVRVGGTFSIDMIDGERVVAHRGEYLEIDPPRLLVFTWISAGTAQQPSVVRVEFHARGDRTELVLTHERLPGTEAAENHRRGWTEIVGTLARRLDPGASPH